MFTFSLLFFFIRPLSLSRGILERGDEGAEEEGGEGARAARVGNPQRFCNKCIDDNKNKNIKGRKDVFLC